MLRGRDLGYKSCALLSLGRDKDLRGTLSQNPKASPTWHLRDLKLKCVSRFGIGVGK